MTLLNRVPSSLVRVAGSAVIAGVHRPFVGARHGGSRPAGDGAARPVLRLWRLEPRRPCGCGWPGTTDGPIGEFSPTGRGSDHPVLRGGWTLREPALQRPAGRVAVSYKFDWDPEKAEANRRKHDVSFHEASTVFADPFAMLMHDPDHSVGEERHLVPGVSSAGR